MDCSRVLMSLPFISSSSNQGSFSFTDDSSTLRTMEVDFLNDPENSHLFEDEEDTRPKESKAGKKKQTSSKKQCNEPTCQKKRRRKNQNW